jgi:release factor glutamine methyltransferase
VRAATAREALDGASTAIAAGGSESPLLDAELLLCEALGVPRERLHTDPDTPVSGAAVRGFQSYVRRRAVDREPVAYIIGRRAFRQLELELDSRVLIPRPETELLVDVALALPAGARVLDLGTGSGAVALALTQERPDLRVEASDVSPGALAVARANAARLGLDVRFHQADLLDGLDGPWAAILANLPYVPSAELRGLEVARHEPQLALDGGADGLDLIRPLIAQRPATGLLALEVGAGQAPAVERLLRDGGFERIDVHNDLAGIARVLVART